MVSTKVELATQDNVYGVGHIKLNSNARSHATIAYFRKRTYTHSPIDLLAVRSFKVISHNTSHLPDRFLVWPM